MKAIASAAQNLRAVRRKLCAKHNLSLRDLYRSVELPGNHPLDIAQDALDAAVRKAYGMKAAGDPLKFLFDLNQKLASLEEQKKPIVGPGLPEAFSKNKALYSEDCISTS